MTTAAYNLRTGKSRLYSCSPREAVMAAYAQERGDWNTSDYGGRYAGVVEQTDLHVFCGDWGALLKEKLL